MIHDASQGFQLGDDSTLYSLRDGQVLALLMKTLYRDFQFNFSKAKVPEIIFTALVKYLNNQMSIVCEIDDIFKVSEVEQIFKVVNSGSAPSDLPDKFFQLLVAIIKTILYLICFDGSLSEARKLLTEFERSNRNIILFYQDQLYHEIEQRIKMSQSMRSHQKHQQQAQPKQFQSQRASENVSLMHHHGIDGRQGASKIQIHEYEYDTGDRDSSGHNSGFGKYSQPQSQRKSDHMSNGSDLMDNQISPIRFHNSKGGVQTTSRGLKYQNRTRQMRREDIGSGQLFRDLGSSQISHQESMHQQQRDYRTHYYALKEKHKQLDLDFKNAIEQIKNLELDLNDAEEEIEEMHLKLDQMVQNYQISEDEKESLKKESEEAKRDLEEKLKANEIAFKEYSDKKEDRERQMIQAIKNLKAQIQEMQQHQVQKKGQTQHLGQMKDKIEKSFHKKINTLRKENQELKVYISQQKQQLNIDLQEIASKFTSQFRQALDNVTFKTVRQIKEKDLEIEEIKSHHEIELRSLKAKLEVYQNQSMKSTSDDKHEIFRLQGVIEQCQNETKKESLARESLLLDMKQLKINHGQELKEALEKQKSEFEEKVVRHLRMSHSKELNEALEKQKQELEEKYVRQMNQRLSEQKYDLVQQLEERVNKVHEEYKALKVENGKIHSPESFSPNKGGNLLVPLTGKENQIIEVLKKEVKEKDALLLQVQSEFEELQQQASKRLQQRKKEIEGLKEENEKLRTELEKCVKHFQQQQLRTIIMRETRGDSSGSGNNFPRSKSQLLASNGMSDQNNQLEANGFGTHEGYDIRGNPKSNGGSVISSINSQQHTPDNLPSFKNQSSSIHQRETESNKSVYQALSQQLQLDDKLNFSGFSQKSSGDFSNKENRLRRQRNSESRMERSHHTEDEENSISFFLSNESSRQRDSSVRKTLEEVTQ